MSLLVNLRRGEGPFWGRLKRLAKRVLHFHIPVFWLTRPLFRGLYLLHVFGRETLASALRFFWYEPLFRSQCESVGDEFQLEQLPYMQGVGRIVLGDRVTLSGKQAFIFGNKGENVPQLVVGDHTFIGHACSFAISSSVTIGNDCLIAGDVRISDYDGHPVDAASRREGNPSPPEAILPVVIGNDVWIGNSANILKGVRIGDRSIVGSCAVVTKDVPPDVVVAGNPARVVKHLAGGAP